MRFARYIALEVAFAVAGLFLVGVGAVRGAAVLSDQWQRREARLLAAASLPPHGELSPPIEIAIAEEPTGTFLGMDDALLLARIRAQPIVAAKLNTGGSSISFRLEFADGSRAAFKPAQTNLQSIPRKEVAAYRLNLLLGLNAVPPAAPRTVGRDELLAHLHPDSRWALPRILSETLFNSAGRTAGMVQYWVPKLKNSGLDQGEPFERSFGWLAVGQPIPVARRELAAQLSNLVVFDFLTANPDRYSGGNMLVSPDEAKLYFMDNTMAFFVEAEGKQRNRNALARTQRFSRRLYGALDGVTARALADALADSGVAPTEILTPAEIRAVVDRRNAVKRHIDGLIAMHGERQVLLFP